MEVYKITRHFPREELYGLTSQARRGAVSAAANIAEGSARHSPRDYLHFLNPAAASLVEVEYYIHLSLRISYISSAEAAALQGMKETGRTLAGLVKSVRENGSAHRDEPTGTMVGLTARVVSPDVSEVV